MFRNEVLDLAKEEVTMLDLDLRETYDVYGSKDLNVLKLLDGVKDDVYDSFTSKSFSEPINVMGFVMFDNKPKKNEGLGETVDEVNKYDIRILRSSLEEQGISEVTTNDKILYLGNTLDIIAVRESNIIGDYFLQYKIIAVGKKQGGFNSIVE